MGPWCSGEGFFFTCTVCMPRYLIRAFVLRGLWVLFRMHGIRSDPGNTIFISKTLVTAVPDPRPGLRHRHAPSAFSDSVRVSMSLCPVSCRVGDSVCAAGLLHVCAPAQPRAKYHILAALRVSHRDGLLLRHAAFGDVRRAHAGRAPHAI